MNLDNSFLNKLDGISKCTTSPRQASDVYNIKRSTLERKIKKAIFVKFRCKTVPKCLDENLNNLWKKCIIDCCVAVSKMRFRLSRVKMRQLTFEYAKKLEKMFPHLRSRGRSPWETNKEAGMDRKSVFNRNNYGQYYDMGSDEGGLSSVIVCDREKGEGNRMRTYAYCLQAAAKVPTRGEHGKGNFRESLFGNQE
ncbi:hypothetical protein HELRODRAFT_166760 [Helobdella robusta]|uniref:Uncharacterized protein n=1 Tax=Helobdella robusta TaxID=6412 RepID=T1EYH4_HELRO|nr:hypothetical protein HELRODRAFT_166760 [Helobdella robusta]ESO11736.1 hypothetical protein HELRODRAFT_166760 [Helobdella robusta]